MNDCYFMINIGNGKELSIEKIKYIIPAEIFSEELITAMNIGYILENECNKTYSYVVFEEFGQRYVIPSNFKSNNLNKKIILNQKRP